MGFKEYIKQINEADYTKSTIVQLASANVSDPLVHTANELLKAQNIIDQVDDSYETMEAVQKIIDRFINNNKKEIERILNIKPSESSGMENPLTRPDSSGSDYEA
jgi:hypoxanthine phosphoribosyltransferase